MPRLFVAAWPPEDVIAELRALGRKDREGVRFVPPERWHVTLRFLGETDPAAVAAALDGASLPAAHARLGPAVDLLAERALVVPVAGVDALAAAVTDATGHLAPGGGDAPRRRFVGHLTLARLGRRAAGRALPPALGTMIDAAFDVTEVALVESRLDPRGARYETLDVWPTVAPPG